MQRNFNRPAVRYLVALLVTGLGLNAQADISTGTMTVSADIAAVCSVSATPMAFASVVPGVTKEAESVISVTCTSGTTYTLDLGDGQNHTDTGGTTTPYRRQMASGANLLPYMVFQETARATEIAATSSPTTNSNLLTSTVGTGSAQTKKVFGSVLGAESVTNPSGSYADLVVITIAF